jgi:hypothetical protein
MPVRLRCGVRRSRGSRTLKKIENGEDVNAASLARLSAFYGMKASELLAPAHFETPKGKAA